MAAAAVCFSSWQARLSQVKDGGASIRQHLLDPLRADAILALGYYASDGCHTLEECGVGTRLHGLNPWAHASMWRIPTASQLAATMERLPHWRAVLKAFHTRRVECRRVADPTATDSSSPYNCSGLFHANSIFSPVLGSTFNLNELMGLRRCLDAISTVEAEQRGHVAYDRVVHSRIEYEWLHRHPPLELLDPTYVWLPAGEDYGGGFNDRHAVLSRTAANVYFGRRWDAIIDGTVMQIEPQLRQGAVVNALAIQGDAYVRNVLEHAGLEVRRFAGVHALGCCVGHCFTGACYKRVLPSRRDFEHITALAAPAREQLPAGGPTNESAVPPALLRAAAALTTAAYAAADGSRRFRAAGAPPPALVSGKYRDELETAIEHSIALQLPGASFELRPDPRFARKARLERARLMARGRNTTQQRSPPLAVVVVGPRSHAGFFSPTLMALRVAQRNFACACQSGLSGAGRRRKVVVASEYVVFE